MTRVAIAFGSNVGDRWGQIHRSLALLGEGLSAMRVSRVFESAPMYEEDQEVFLNGVVTGVTELGPIELLRVLKGIEDEVGRKHRFRNGPREIDLDLLVYGSLVYRSERLVLPHAKIGERRFVLEPFCDVGCDWVVPGVGKVSDLLAAELVQNQEIREVKDAALSV